VHDDPVYPASKRRGLAQLPQPPECVDYGLLGDLGGKLPVAANPGRRAQRNAVPLLCDLVKRRRIATRRPRKAMPRPTPCPCT
jgi:hypothetical protein